MDTAPSLSIEAEFLRLVPWLVSVAIIEKTTWVLAYCEHTQECTNDDESATTNFYCIYRNSVGGTGATKFIESEIALLLWYNPLFGIKYNISFRSVDITLLD